MTKPEDKLIRYRDYEISVEPSVFRKHVYAHKDFDGPEDGRCGFQPSVQDCIDAIDEQIDESACDCGEWECSECGPRMSESESDLVDARKDGDV